MLATLMLPLRKERPDGGGVLTCVEREAGAGKSFPSVEPAVGAGVDSLLAGSAGIIAGSLHTHTTSILELSSISP